MKKIFFKRHLLFFVTMVILCLCCCLIAKKWIMVHRCQWRLREENALLNKTLQEKLSVLPVNYQDVREQMVHDINYCRDFAAAYWGDMLQLKYCSHNQVMPANDIGLAFEISDYLDWAKNSCDALGIEFSASCTFGFKDFFDSKTPVLASELYDLHQQKEQLKVLLSFLFESRLSYLKLVSVERCNLQPSVKLFDRDTFKPDVRMMEKAKSYVYRVRFASFTDSFRLFMQRLYENHVPAIFRQIDVQPNFSFRMEKRDDSFLLDCLPSTFSLIIELLDVPQDVVKHGAYNSSLTRRIHYFSL